MIEGKIDKIQIWNNMIEASKLIIFNADKNGLESFLKIRCFYIGGVIFS